MNKNIVLLIHGFEGTPNGSWRPWLMRELEKICVYTAALALPNPNKPILEGWMQAIDNVVQMYPKQKIYFVGHSLGVPAILQYIQQYQPNNVRGSVLVAGPIRNDKKVLMSFFEKELDFAILKKFGKRFSVIHGDNDRFVPFVQAETLSQGLGCNLHKIKKGGHLNEYDGCVELPLIMDELMGFMKS